MIKYSFDQRFAEAVILGRKTMSVRASRANGGNGGDSRRGQPLRLINRDGAEEVRLVSLDPICDFADLRAWMRERFALPFSGLLIHWAFPQPHGSAQILKFPTKRTSPGARHGK